jgi:hypothetical protein
VKTLTGALVALAFALAVASPAAAAPVITYLKLRALPVPGVAGTGDVLGAGALIAGSTKIVGSEYDNSPPPLTSLTFYVPPGTRVDRRGFTTCSATTLELRGPEGCPKRSGAGPGGFAVGDVSFEGERVAERASIRPFLAPGSGYEVYIDGHSPVLLEILAKAHVAPAASPFGLAVVGEIPLITTVPEAPDASFVEGSITVGAAYRQGHRTVSLVTLPTHCPNGGWAVEELMRFLGGSEASANGKLPCPPS